MLWLYNRPASSLLSQPSPSSDGQGSNLPRLWSRLRSADMVHRISQRRHPAPCGLHPHPFKVASPVPWCNLRKIGIVSRLDSKVASWSILHYVARKCIFNILLHVVKVPVGRVAATSIQKAVRKLHCTKLKARVLYSLSPAKVLLPMSHPSSATSWICRSPSGL